MIMAELTDCHSLFGLPDTFTSQFVMMGQNGVGQ